MLAMVLFEGGRHALGGAVLAFTIASKLFPGLLVIYLLARRQYRAVAWTAASGLGYIFLTFGLLGWMPYASSFQQLPGPRRRQGRCGWGRGCRKTWKRW